MNELWYPGKQIRKPTGKYYPPKRKKKRLLCYLCDGKGLVNDLRTGLLRGCLCCNGTGRIKTKL